MFISDVQTYVTTNPIRYQALQKKKGKKEGKRAERRTKERRKENNVGLDCRSGFLSALSSMMLQKKDSVAFSHIIAGQQPWE